MRYKAVILAVVILLAFAVSATRAAITDVQIIPDEPTSIDSIAINVTGMEGSGGVLITNTNFSIIDNSLTLDIYLSLGQLAIMTPWSYTENIGTLPEGTYTLTINRFLPSYYPPPVVNSFSTSFEVVPEPCTIVFLGLGITLFRFSSKIKH